MHAEPLRGPQTLSAGDSTPLLSPFVHSSKEDSDSEYWNETDEAFFANADFTTPQSIPLALPLSRWSKQGPSATYKIAYVLFAASGEQESLGVYYNWAACSHSITAGGGKDFCAFRGYSDYDLAHSAWTGFQQTGILPSGLNLPRYSRGTTPQRSSRGTTPQQSPATSPATPQRSSRSHAPVTPQRSSRHGTPGPALSSPVLSPASAVEEPQFPQFWVVLSGDEPGVYQALTSARHAIGAQNSQPPLPANSRQSANQIFVDGYMARRVNRVN